jgi:hypothetical protein
MAPYLEREVPADALANLRFAAFARPDFLVDRAPRPDDLLRRSRYAPALRLLAIVPVPGPSAGGPGPFYSLYRVNWAVADSLGATPGPERR